MKTAMGSLKDRERIYIGGLDPPRLTGKDVLRRLESLQHIEIVSASMANNRRNEVDHIEDYESSKNDRPYIHIAAISNHPSDSAFLIIHKHYHNVKWKGCKLVIELAKPHFLERLKQERLHQQLRLVPTAIPAESATNTTKDPEIDKKKLPSLIPRRLRVRKKHGDGAVHVDTKPWTVETWSRFNKARHKLKAREQTHRENILSRTSLLTPLMYRAVHIRFLAEENGTMNHGFESQEKVISSSESAASSDKESELSNEDIRYKWPDDESNSENSEENEYSDEQKSSAFLFNQGPILSNDITLHNQKKEIYNWSSDEDASESEEERVNPSTPGEHESTKNMGYTENEKDNLGDHENCHDFSKDDGKKFSDLSGDVTTNLNILSSIFPGMTNARPCDLDRLQDFNADDGKDKLFDTGKKNSKYVHTIMPRYDPSVKSSRIYNMKEESEETELEISAKNLSFEEKTDEDLCENQINDHDTRQMETKGGSQIVPTVYEQDKLENIFRDARNSWGINDGSTTTKPNIHVTASNTDNSSRNNFGFDIDDDHSEKLNKQVNKSNVAENSFSFHFDVGSQDQGDKNPSISMNNISNIEQKDSKSMEAISLSSDKEHNIVGDSVDEKAKDIVEKRSKGFTLSDENLQKCVSNFFACNDGVRIMQNPLEFTNDDKERATWNCERQSLTLDWKRKRKYAITRIQKRIKFRRR